MKNLEQNKLALLPFFVGLAFLLYSWYISFPISIEFPGDSAFNHISPFYWLSVPLILGSLYVLGLFSKRRSLKCVVSVAMVVAIYSLTYFYISMPTSDSQLFRGLTEYFINTQSLDISQFGHIYFSWPSYFLLADIVTSVTGLSVIDFEFLFYAAIGVLLTVTLYVYASKLFKDGALLAVVSFFISTYWIINYQSVPFSFALALTFVLFLLETRKKSTPTIVLMLAIFFTISFTHFFVASFFILYLIFRSLIGKSKQYVKLSLLTLTIYLVTQITFVPWTYIELTFRLLLTHISEYGSIATSTLSARPPILADMIAQTMSRAVTITVILMCFLVFIYLVVRRKLRAIDSAIFLSGLTYSALGLVFYSLGSRAIPILLIPVSLGAAYLFVNKFRSYVKVIFLVLLILWVFVPIHNSYNSFSNSFVPLQTNEAYDAENFLLDHYNWTKPSLILLHAPPRVYLSMHTLEGKQINARFEDDYFSPLFPRLNEYDAILYTVGLGNSFLKYNYTIEWIVNEENLSYIYNNGFSTISVKGSSFSPTPK